MESAAPITPVIANVSHDAWDWPETEDLDALLFGADIPEDDDLRPLNTPAIRFRQVHAAAQLRSVFAGWAS